MRRKQIVIENVMSRELDSFRSRDLLLFGASAAAIMIDIFAGYLVDTVTSLPIT
jgi:hypothetical protein